MTIMLLVVRGKKLAFIRADDEPGRSLFLHNVFCSILMPLFPDCERFPDDELRIGVQEGDKIIRFYTDEEGDLHGEANDEEFAALTLGALVQAFNMEPMP